MDVFSYLFKGKGRHCGNGYFEVSLEDFDAEVFPSDWYIHCDQNGDGCCVHFPMKLKSTLTWKDLKNYKKFGGTLVPMNKTFMEKLYIVVLKARL